MRSLFHKLCEGGVIALLIASGAAMTAAQEIPTAVVGLQLSASVDNPTPGQNVTITAQSYSINISSANITWNVAGVQKQKGIGLTTLVVPAPASGKRTTVSVTAVASDGTSYNNSISIGSGSVDMLMETSGYVPPFFRGKLPISYQNSIKVIAIPHIADSSGKEYGADSLVYEWKKDTGTILQSQSGYGKQSITVVGSTVPRPYYLTVNVSTRDGSASANGVVQINQISPTLVFYQDDPLYGPFFNKAVVGTMNIGSQQESGVLAVPYGFDKPYGNIGDLSFDWLINGSLRRELSGNESVTLRAPGDTGGSSQVSLNIRNNNQILQGAKSGFLVTFLATSSAEQATF